MWSAAFIETLPWLPGYCSLLDLPLKSVGTSRKQMAHSHWVIEGRIIKGSLQRCGGEGSGSQQWLRLETGGAVTTARVERWEQLAELLYGGDTPDRSCGLQREAADLGQPIRKGTRGKSAPSLSSHLWSLPVLPIGQIRPIAKGQGSLGKLLLQWKVDLDRKMEHVLTSSSSLRFLLSLTYWHFFHCHLCKHSILKGSVCPSFPCSRQSHLVLDFNCHCSVDDF